MTKLPALADLISLRGKRALVTGAAAGIGRAISQRMGEAGAALELVDIDAAKLEATRAELQGTGVNVRTHVIDMSKKAEIDALWHALRSSLPDILVNNAGIYPFKPFLDSSEAFAREVLETNLFSVYWMCQHMIRSRGKSGGVIINLGSIEAVMAFKSDLAHYGMSKAGVIALTRALAKEYGGHGFRVNALLPGGINTPGTRSAAKDILKFRFGLLRTGLDFSRRLPIGRAGKPDEVARMALVLASDLAEYVHGATIAVDGGFLAA